MKLTMPVKSSVFCLLFVLVASVWAVPQKKLIYYGWDTPNQQNFITQADVIASLDFAGYVVSLESEDENGFFQAGMVQIARKYQENGFEKMRPDLEKMQEIVSETGTELFAMVWSNPDDISWFDDAGWDAILNNVRLLARYAKLGGFKGLCFDPEPYTAARPYNYKSDGVHSFAETVAKVRERGRAYIGAIQEEFPDAVILTFGLWSWCFWYNGQVGLLDNPTAQFEFAGNGLLCEFANGWLEDMIQSIRIIDAPEAAYHFLNAIDYYKLAILCKSRGGITERLIPEHLLTKFRRQVEFGYGMFVDVFIERGAVELGKNIDLACTNSDEYVWFYAEKGKFWPVSQERGPHSNKDWDEFIPGIRNAIRYGLNPLKNSIVSETNLAQNGDMSQGHEGYGEWIAEWSKGKTVVEPDAMRLDGVLEGCLTQDIDVLPGQYYKISVKAKKQGNSVPILEIRWKNEAGEWRQMQEMAYALYFPKAAEGWDEETFYVKTPEGDVRKMSCLLNSRNGQDEEADKVWFDDLQINQLTMPQ